MRKSIGLSLVAATLLAGTAMADEGKVSGDIRALYMNTNTGYGQPDSVTGATEDGASALSLGINALYESPKLGNASFGIGFAAQSNVVEAGVVEGQSLASDQAIDENGLMNQLYVAYDSPIGTIKAGKQVLDTPGAGSDDVRLTPNTFEAVVLINSSVPNTTLIGAQVATMSGWDNAGSNGLAGYNSMTDAALYGAANSLAAGAGITGAIDVEDNGATVLAAIYGNDAISASVWSYNITNTSDVTVNGDTVSVATAGAAKDIQVSTVSLNYVDAGYALDLGAMKLNIAGQYYSFAGHIDDPSNALTVGNKIMLDHRVGGAKVELETDMGVSALVATNTADGEHTVINAWGGYPEYAIADEFWMNSFDNKKFSTTKVGLGYAMGDMSVSGAMVNFAGDANEGDIESASVTDVMASYSDFSLVYESVSQTHSKKGSLTADPDDYTLLKVAYTTTF